MIQLEQQQHGEFEGGWVGGVVAYINYLYPARWGWINMLKYTPILVSICQNVQTKVNIKVFTCYISLQKIIHKPYSSEEKIVQ